ncbi:MULTISPECIES: hypothetical protein [Streptomyces]|uniref:hypothetical protein n=1 Tax=Streptomyces TaxID=1883 RepID=UPI000699C7FB|nr:hypothetical protein [Streptomyces sp. SID7805]MYU55014.1 hypothetical protein [Streptomyces sp. SID7805]
MRLPKEAIGFRDRGDEPFPEVSGADFRSACHVAARAVRGRVVEFDPAQNPRSFHSADIVTADGIHAVVCLVHVPWVIFCDQTPTEYGGTVGFRSPPPWADAFTYSGFRLLQLKELAMPWDRVDSTALTAAACRQIQYWRPDNLAEALLNWWD